MLAMSRISSGLAWDTPDGFGSGMSMGEDELCLVPLSMSGRESGGNIPCCKKRLRSALSSLLISSMAMEDMDG